VTLLDSKRIRTLFLREVAQQAELINTTIICERIENMSLSRFDFITARAVATLIALWQWCRPLLRENGFLIAMKGGELHDELAQLVLYFNIHYRVRPLYQNDSALADKKLVIVSF
jgi:16S rRNA (guanine527-N7)-methyltransferase